MSVKGSMPRPQSVSVALWLIVASWAVSFTLVVWRLLISPTLPGEQRPNVAASVVVIAIALALSGGLLAALACRRRWAYILWLVWFALSLLSSLSSLGRSGAAFDLAPLRVAWWLVDFAVQVAAIVLMLRRPARVWYGISRPPASPGEWRSDPSGRHQHRYWDGAAWTEHVADDGAAGVDPVPEAQG
jgi:hypothetical protein